MSNLQFFLPISKVDKPRRMVWGYASTPTLDLDNEIVEIEALKAALPSYMEWRNIREMHQPSAVGVASEANIDARGLYIGAKIVDDEAWKKVETQVYKGFSIGGRTLAKDGNRITALELIEISLVDRPANPDCRIEVVKAASGPEPLTIRADEAGALRKFFTRLFGDKVSKAEATDAVAYADPGFQTDGKRRYPIDTASHIRAAWAFIHMPRNRALYNTAELTRVETNIVAAWKSKIDAAGPPAAKSKKQLDPIKGASTMAHEFAKRASAGYRQALGQALQHLGKAASLHEAGMACMEKGDYDDAHNQFAAMAGHHQAIAHHLAKAAAAADDDDDGSDEGDWSNWDGAQNLAQDVLTEGDVPDYVAEDSYPGKFVRRRARKFGRTDRSLVERLIKSELSRAAAEAKVEVLSQLPVGNPRARLFAIDKGALAGAGNGGADAVGTLMQGVDLNRNNPAAATESATRMLSNMFANPAMFGKNIADPNFRGSASRSRN